MKILGFDDHDAGADIADHAGEKDETVDDAQTESGWEIIAHRPVHMVNFERDLIS